MRPGRGRQRTFTSLQRAQMVALACARPDVGKPWQRWSGEKLAQVAVEQQIVADSPGTIRRWLREDKIKPWRYHSWQHSTDPQFVEKAAPVLDLYTRAGLAEPGRSGPSVLMKRPRFKPVSASLPRKPQPRAMPCRWPIAINGWARCNSSVPWSWPRG